MKKKVISMLTIATMTLLLGACSSSKEKEATKESSSTTESSAVAESTEETETSKSKIKEKSEAGSEIFSKLVPELKETLRAEEVNTIGQNSQEIVSEQGDINVSLEGYELVEVKDFHNDFSIPFGKQTDRGGVLLTKYTITNTSSEDRFYPLIPEFTFTGATKAYMSTKSLLPEENSDHPYITSRILKAENKLAAGESFTGYSAVAIDPAALDAIVNQGFITMTVKNGYKVADSFKTADKIGAEETIDLAISAEGQEEVAAASEFLKDKASTANMGKKTLISEKKALSESQTSDGVIVTLKEYQFTDFEPNEVEEPRFKNFEEGVVLLTASFDVNNTGDKVVGFTGTSSTLKVNNKSQSVLSEGMLMSYGTTDLVKKGEKKELIQVYVMNKEEFDKIWKDKEFGLELQLRDDASKDLGKGQKMIFDLPK